MITEHMGSKVWKRLFTNALIRLHIRNVIARPGFGSTRKPPFRQAFYVIFAVSLRRTTGHCQQLDEARCSIPSFSPASPAINKPAESVNLVAGVYRAIAYMQQLWGGGLGLSTSLLSIGQSVSNHLRTYSCLVSYD